MMTELMPYQPTIVALGAAGGLLLLQLTIAGYASAKAKHPPGTPITTDRTSFLFRATRAHANTNETIATFIAAALFGILLSGSPVWLNACAWLYVASRISHMLCYYTGKELARSLSFGFSSLALAGMLTTGIVAWIL